MKRPAVRQINRMMAMADRVVPAGRGIVVRTFPDYDDQCREIGAALHSRGVEMTLLVDDERAPRPLLPFPCRIVRSTSAAAAWAFLRARVVVHTHGVYGNIAGASSKRFVNLWHGMPVKRLPAGTDLGRNQTDITLATSPLHAANLADTWGLDLDQVLVVGLPRNDALVRPELATDPEAPGAGRPLAVWLPTFRSRPGRPGEQEGIDLGTVTQFEGADLERIHDMAARSGFHILVKPHPAAAPPEAVEREHLTVWGNEDLRARGWTLYRLLARADLLITDVSSVWIDFLAVDRPVLFAMSDKDDYLAGRGSYFQDLDDLVPGRICTDIDELEQELLDHADGADPWREVRGRVRELHHSIQAGSSADDVADVIVRFLRDTGG